MSRQRNTSHLHLVREMDDDEDDEYFYDEEVRDRSISAAEKSIYFVIWKQSSATVVYLYMYSYSPFNDIKAIQIIAGNLPSTIKTLTIHTT